MATARVVSPGGALLRTSRLFSLPSQLRPPTSDALEGLSYSDRSTEIYPTLQSIISPESSRKHGDWGFKRPLPKKMVRNSSNPVIRVKSVDSIERVTDFARASDHTLALRKFQELNLPITVQMDTGRDNFLPGKSVFEEDGDITAFVPGQKDGTYDKRWRFHGPWLPKLTEGDFQKYLKHSIRTRRVEFREFLKTQLAEGLNKDAAAKALDSGEDVPPKVVPSDITDEQMTQYLRELRNSQSRHNLYDTIAKFLDLAPMQQNKDYLSQLRGRSKVAVAKTQNPHAAEGPPVTHPSAGISYLRTDAYIDNHPVYGPQKHHYPISSRIIMPKAPGSGMPAKFGVAGFVANGPEGDITYNTKMSKRSQLKHFNHAIPGESKTHVTPASVRIDPTGRVQLKLRTADREARSVTRELEGKESVFDKPALSAQPSTPANSALGNASSRTHRQQTDMYSSRKSYGMDITSGRPADQARFFSR